MRHPAQKLWLGKKGIGVHAPTALSDEHIDAMDEVLTTKITEGDRRELENGNGSRWFADRKRE